jgi:hypothetical protein
MLPVYPVRVRSRHGAPSDPRLRMLLHGSAAQTAFVATGVYREFEPYAVAVGLVRDRQRLKKFLSILCG